MSGLLDRLRTVWRWLDAKNHRMGLAIVGVLVAGLITLNVAGITLVDEEDPEPTTVECAVSERLTEEYEDTEFPTPRQQRIVFDAQQACIAAEDLEDYIRP